MPVELYSSVTRNLLSHRASQIYAILIGLAHGRQTYTYGMIAELLGYGGAGVLDRQLGLIMFWCDDHGLPPLTVLVVNQDTGLPGEGLMQFDDMHGMREAVFNHDWFDVVAPTPEELKLYESRLRAPLAKV